jgi:hypothetical protein
MEAATRLAAVLAAKSYLNDDELGLYRTLMSYLEKHYRLALLTLERQAREEGLIDEGFDEDVRGYSEANA